MLRRLDAGILAWTEKRLHAFQKLTGIDAILLTRWLAGAYAASCVLLVVCYLVRMDHTSVFWKWLCHMFLDAQCISLPV